MRIATHVAAFVLGAFAFFVLAAPLRMRTTRERHVILYLSEFARVTRIENNSGFIVDGIRGIEIRTRSAASLAVLTNSTR